AALPAKDDPKYADVARRLLKLMSAFAGDAEVLRIFSDDDLRQLAGSKEEMVRWSTRRSAMTASRGEMATLQEQRSDPQARQRLREVVAEDFGLFGQAGLFKAQLEYLNNDGSVSALDNELALLWWDYYSRSAMLNNPMHYRF